MEKSPFCDPQSPLASQEIQETKFHSSVFTRTDHRTLSSARRIEPTPYCLKINFNTNTQRAFFLYFFRLKLCVLSDPCELHPPCSGATSHFIQTMRWARKQRSCS